MPQPPQTLKVRGRRTAFQTAVLLLILLPLARPTGATPGDLDGIFAGFGNQGIVSTLGVTTAMALAPDGKIVTVGHSGTQLIARRYLANGSLDPTFGAGGSASFLNRMFSMRAGAVAVQPNGKIVIAGYTETENDNFLVARVNATGTIDGSFGSGGYATVDFAGQGDYAGTVLVQPDGKIVVAGTATVGADEDFSVARFTATGLLDATFSGDGKLTIGFGGDDYCRDAALMEDGRILLVGDGSDEFPYYDVDVCMAQLHADGTFDASFDFDGKLTAGLGDHDVASAVAFQPDGKIVIAGYSNPPNPTAKLARFHASGLPDNSFDGDGIMSMPGERLEDLLIQPDGRMLVMNRTFSIYRRMPDGAADPSFDGDGGVTYVMGPAQTSRDMELLSDGRILVHGSTGPDYFTQTATAMIRVWPDGAEDIGGRQALAFDEQGVPSGAGFPPGSAEAANDMAIQGDGKIVVVGQVVHPVSGESDVALARFTPDGELDTSFGTNGRVSFSFHNYDVGTAVAIQPDGRIVVAGYTGTGFGINFLVARFLTSGNLDNTFGFGGFNVIDISGWDDYAHDVAVAPDGKIVLAGAAFDGSHYVFGVARFTSEGVADYSFDGDARRIVDFGAGIYHDGRAMIVQPDGKIVVGGGVGYDFGLARLNENGSLDDTFGCQGDIGDGDPCGGTARIDMGGQDLLYDIGRAPNGWLYAAGTSLFPARYMAAVAQFNENGRLAACPPFPCVNWPTGKVHLNWGSFGVAYAIDVRDDGQIVIAGEADGVFQWAQFDPASTTPTVASSADLVGSREYANAVKFTGFNQLVLAGRQLFNGDESIALARFETTAEATVAVPDAGLPEGTSLGALAPNPASASASLAFALARRSAVELRVHDVAGRLIRVIHAGALPAGHHRVTWDGRGDDGSRTHAGVFFVSLRAEGRAVGSRTLVVGR